MVDEGKNIQIIGYDGRVFKDLFSEIEDTSKPFGHELVLCGLLRKELVWDWKIGKYGFLIDENGNIVIEFDDEE